MTDAVHELKEARLRLTVLKHTLAYSIWMGMMDRAEVTRDQVAIEALHRKAARLNLERARDRITIDEVEASYERAWRWLNRRLHRRSWRSSTTKLRRTGASNTFAAAITDPSHP